MEPNNTKDSDLWKTAHQRAGFKIHITIYFIVILFLWVLWGFLAFINDWEYSFKWPIFPMFAWGLGVILHYIIVYNWKHKLTQKEYDKLLEKENTVSKK